MKNKRYIIPILAVIVLLVVLVVIFIMPSRHDGTTLESRELRLNQVNEHAHIITETTIEDYIISGYTTGNRFGLAIFAPQGAGEYEFQTNFVREDDQIIVGHMIVKEKNYDLFWANKANLSYAEITYTVEGQESETIRLDATDNKILYYQAPYKNYNVEVAFGDSDGNIFS